MSLETFVSICQAFSVSADYLLRDELPKNAPILLQSLSEAKKYGGQQYSSRPLLTLLIVSENPPGKKALEIKDFFITKYRFFQNRTLSYRPISIFFSCCCISRLTPATGLISGFYQFLPGALIAFFVVFFNRAYTGAIRIMEFL